MNVSLGIYSIALLFIYIIIPGFLSRRFYYHGEFSKQINISSSPILQLVQSSLTGLVVTFSFISILNCSDNVSINFDKTLKTFQSNYLEDSSSKNKTNDPKNSVENEIVGDNDNLYTIYLPFIAGLYFFSIISGYFLSKIVLVLKLDTKFKFLRFSNDWHYIFNGRIFYFKKNSFQGLTSNLEIKYTYIDVLVSNENEKPSLYSGFLADYDLDRNNISKIERLHLLKAIRYKKDETTNTIIQRNIPGDIFTIIGDRIININCIYIFYDKNEISIKKFNQQKKILFYAQLFLVILFSLVSTVIIAKIHIPQYTVLNSILAKSFWYRITVIYVINIFIGLLIPFKVDREESVIKFLGHHYILLNLLLIVLIGFALYLYL